MDKEKLEELCGTCNYQNKESGLCDHPRIRRVPAAQVERVERGYCVIGAEKNGNGADCGSPHLDLTTKEGAEQAVRKVLIQSDNPLVRELGVTAETNDQTIYMIGIGGNIERIAASFNAAMVLYGSHWNVNVEGVRGMELPVTRSS